MNRFFFKELKIIDILTLIILPIFSALVSLILKTNLLISTLLFFGLPAFYLSMRTPKSIIKSLIFTTLVTFSFSIGVDYLGEINHVWLTTNSISSFRIFGVLPIENPVWAFLYIYNVIIFYEHFLQNGTHKYKNHHEIYFIGILLSFVSAIILISVINYSVLKNIPYSYLIFGAAFFLIPLIMFITSFPKYIHKFAISASYFIFISLLNELTALQLQYWTFPGKQVIGWIEILNLKFPLEEFFFFIIIGSTVILSYYEYFFDNRK